MLRERRNVGIRKFIIGKSSDWSRFFSSLCLKFYLFLFSFLFSFETVLHSLEDGWIICLYECISAFNRRREVMNERCGDFKKKIVRKSCFSISRLKLTSPYSEKIVCYTFQWRKTHGRTKYCGPARKDYIISIKISEQFSVFLSSSANLLNIDWKFWKNYCWPSPLRYQQTLEIS